MSDFKLVNVVDSMIEDIQPEISLPVISGVASNTYMEFNSQQANGNTQIQYNVTVPSIETVVAREFLMETAVRLRIDFDTTKDWAANQVLFSYGKTNSLQNFPVNSLFTTVQSNINNATVSVNSRQVMAPLLKMFNYRELAEYNSLCPSMPDSFYLNYADGIGSNNSALANYSVGGYDKKYEPRGCFPVTLYDNTGLPLNSLEVKCDAAGKAPYPFIYLDFKTTEPMMMLSPYISGSSNNKSGFIGINTLTITANLGTADRCMSNASFGTKSGELVLSRTISKVSLENYTSAKLLLQFKTPSVTMYSKIEPKSVVNYNQYEPYSYSSGVSIAPKATQTLTFNSVQLNQIPSRILIFARKTTLDTYDSNSFMVINGTSINFANKSGLLSTANQQQLYQMSVRNGLQQSYYEYSGSGISNNSAGAPTSMPTIGSVLAIDPSLDLSIDAPYTNGSSGQFNLQFNVTVTNQGDDAITPTLFLVVVNSGIFVTENGASSYTTGLINKEMVLETKVEDSVIDTDSYHKKVVGGSIENLTSIHKHLKGAFSKASEIQKKIDNVGSGMSAGSMSAGDVQGGIKRRIHKYA